MTAEMEKPIVNEIEEIMARVPGWTPLDQLYSLFMFVYTSRDNPADIVEVGSWCGRSAVVMGRAIQLTRSSSKIHCVDLFPAKADWYQNEDRSYSFRTALQGQSYDGYNDQTVDEEPYLRDIVPVYEQHDSVLDIFNQHISVYGLKDICIPFQTHSPLFFEKLPQDTRYKLAFLDGDHSYKGLSADIRATEKYLISGGWISFDDAFSGYYPGVDQAITDLVIKNDQYQNQQQLTRKFFVAQKR